MPATVDDPFEWARGELRKGRPLLAAFPREIWQALPPGFIAAHPWGGGNVGHQIVVNGFTWNSETKQGTFHIINSWAELPEFDLKTEAAKGGALVISYSMLPKGEAPPVAEKRSGEIGHARPRRGQNESLRRRNQSRSSENRRRQ